MERRGDEEEEGKEGGRGRGTETTGAESGVTIVERSVGVRGRENQNKRIEGRTRREPCRKSAERVAKKSNTRC
jgi:hypothetical protein